MQQIHRNIHRSSRSMPGPAKFFIVLLVLAGASFCLAFAWQTAQDGLWRGAEPALEQDTGEISASPVANTKPLPSSSSRPASSSSASSAAPKPPAGIKTASEAAKASAAKNGGAQTDKPETGNYARPLKEGALAASEAVGYDYFEDAIFFGDSLSTGIPLYMKSTIPGVAVVAAQGVSPEGANSAAVIKSGDTRVTFLKAAEAEGERAKIYVMLGANALDLSLEPFMQGYVNFVRSLKAAYPGSVIYIQSMLPVTRFVNIEYPNPNINNGRISEYNDAIRKMAIEENVYYLDVSQGMEDAEGYLPDEASFDGMHMTPEYYFKWFDYLRTHTLIPVKD